MSRNVLYHICRNVFWNVLNKIFIACLFIAYHLKIKKTVLTMLFYDALNIMFLIMPRSLVLKNNYLYIYLTIYYQCDCVVSQCTYIFGLPHFFTLCPSLCLSLALMWPLSFSVYLSQSSLLCIAHLSHSFCQPLESTGCSLKGCFTSLSFKSKPLC